MSGRARVRAALKRQASALTEPSLAEDEAMGLVNDELHAMRRDPRSSRNRRQLLAAAELHGVSNIRVFGSTARGENTASSDVDLLVDLDSGRTLVDLAGFRVEAEAILGTPVDVATEDMLKSDLRDGALADAMPL